MTDRTADRTKNEAGYQAETAAVAADRREGVINEATAAATQQGINQRYGGSSNKKTAPYIRVSTCLHEPRFTAGHFTSSNLKEWTIFIFYAIIFLI